MKVEDSSAQLLHRHQSSSAVPGQSRTIIEAISVPIWKRIVDIVGATTLIVLISPLLVIVSLLIKASSPSGSILFVQERVGWRGKKFRIFKFRTMRTNVDTAQHRRYVADLACGGGALDKPEMASRLIWLGRFYRAAAIDELPQLFNVLRGEMSLVGPRPDVLDLEDYEPWQRNRFAVLPGLTGLWQVSGKNRLTFDEMIELDLRYVRTHSLLMDISVLVRTPIAIVTM
jgi:lipopolysaccharide/colanic/teichoic acid biosynthesis glycosyltransferase